MVGFLQVFAPSPRSVHSAHRCLATRWSPKMFYEINAFKCKYNDYMIKSIKWGLSERGSKKGILGLYGTVADGAPLSARPGPDSGLDGFQGLSVTQASCCSARPLV